MTVTGEVNKSMAKLGDGFKTELKQVVLNAGAEMTYLDLISFRGGYIYDEEGDVKVGTLGVGLPTREWRRSISRTFRARVTARSAIRCCRHCRLDSNRKHYTEG